MGKAQGSTPGLSRPPRGPPCRRTLSRCLLRGVLWAPTPPAAPRQGQSARWTLIQSLAQSRLAEFLEDFSIEREKGESEVITVKFLYLFLMNPRVTLSNLNKSASVQKKPPQKKKKKKKKKKS